MKPTIVILLAVGIAALVVMLVSRAIRRRGGKAAATAEHGPMAVARVETPPLLPEVVFGTSPSSRAVTVRPLPLETLASFDDAPTARSSLGVTSRLSALMQAVPSLLVSEAHRGRQLMEVVIDGKLIRAADGDGFRAMTMGTKGIQQNARLYEPENLSNLVNAAAVWQLASVVVAQKHLADISEKLTEIKEGVTNISTFLDDQRRSTIRGTYQYLEQAHAALEKGELSEAIRGQLEACEVNLLGIQDHLLTDIERRARVTLKDDDTFGTESLHKNGVAKFKEMVQIADDLRICLMTRALAWYVLSLYPGEPALKDARQVSLQKGLEQLKDVRSWVHERSYADVEAFKSWLNRSKTLEERKDDVLSEARRVTSRLDKAHAGTSGELERTQTLLLERDAPTQLMVELIDGSLRQVRQRELVAA